MFHKRDVVSWYSPVNPVQIKMGNTASKVPYKVGIWLEKKILFSEKEGGEEEERSLEEEEEEEEEAPDIVMAWNMAKYLPEDGSIQVL
jgi:hypothetical protein